jgi:hypothetical protein
VPPSEAISPFLRSNMNQPSSGWFFLYLFHGSMEVVGVWAEDVLAVAHLMYETQGQTKPARLVRSSITQTPRSIQPALERLMRRDRFPQGERWRCGSRLPHSRRISS